MPAYFTTIRAKVAEDIVTAFGSGVTVLFGQPRKKKLVDFPTAVVRSNVSRQGVARQVQETYLFEIDLKFALPDPQVTDIESFLYEKADLLVMQLAPFDTNDPPVSSGPYAGLASLRRVTDVIPGDDEDTDNFCSVRVMFSCMATVYQ